MAQALTIKANTLNKNTKREYVFHGSFLAAQAKQNKLDLFK
jgi:hypothetical protein